MAALDTTYVLAIDLGSGGPKVALVSERGELIAHTSGRIATFHTPDGGGEQDPDEWWRVTSGCAREVLGRGLVPLERVAAVSCASQWSVTVPVDRDGRHLMNAVHWSDARGAIHSKRITGGLLKVAGYGLGALSMGAADRRRADALGGRRAAHILFILHERPEIYRQTYKFLEPMDYLNFRLTGARRRPTRRCFPIC